MASSLPSVACFTLLACILGVDIHTRRMCATDRPIAQGSGDSATSTSTGHASTAALPADNSPDSLAGIDQPIEFRIRNRDLVVQHPDETEIFRVVHDIQIDVDLIRPEPDSKDETAAGH